MSKAYIALGTNIEPKQKHLADAVHFLNDSTGIQVKGESSIYETKPVGYADQDNFLNMVVEVETSLGAYDLLRECQSIEANLGRTREIRFGPRTIDLDILLFDKEDIQSEELTVPHPRMVDRAFVLIPLYDLNPSVYINGRSLEQWLGQLSEQDKKDVIKLHK
ncbi:2-amino-4-hydroxy-6-hydroxymethyldihydropteridine diphosphokinase [Halalkalibacillus sediminis]|uniref:2-amino-4-hydroxy-6-hydroxymethyldihydropteridine diphosphokinase n=1 Tax=Halalkalibacillus sediminis TaxID=2018042 RepID=A0A2I0QT52_9BACI|nr:2-amino-4-hydroxy-6-hydroxymethyldihydropteridine diphosphokinase [Halalkalibacillus sediminis]PKR77523.1 2-amino-4-hydroxy-6-hydroxymethyldihydropteridine diphosphokinase [Halalkalibacillus sediminis]